GNGRLEYWPHLGNGRFGPAVVMEGAPDFAPEGELDPRRLLFVSLTGGGPSDLLYVGAGEIRWWLNSGGNRLLPGAPRAGLPLLDDPSSLRVIDVLADGRPCLVWSTASPGAAAAMRWLPLMGEVPARLVVSVEDGLGRETRLAYGSSASHYLR